MSSSDTALARLRKAQRSYDLSNADNPSQVAKALTELKKSRTEYEFSTSAELDRKQFHDEVSKNTSQIRAQQRSRNNA